MKNLCFKLSVVLVCTMLFSCGTKELDLTEDFLKNSKNGVLHLDRIDIGSQWEKILILKPYDSVDTYNIHMESSDKKDLEAMEQIDTKCAILFLKTDSLVAYTFIPRGRLDFSFLPQRLYEKSTRFRIAGNKLSEM